MKLQTRSGQFTGYREKTFGLMRDLLEPLGQIQTAIDVGAGEGWYANRLMQERFVQNSIPVEVSRRKHLEVAPIIYDGKTLPFLDNSVPLVYSIDVVHHAENPFELLDEIARISSKWILLKDHTFDSFLGQMTLQILDELGNRRFGISSPGKYQRAWTWLEHLESRGYKLLSIRHPASCHTGILGVATNKLQFIALLEKTHAY
jgi:hypothetical protein